MHLKKPLLGVKWGMLLIAAVPIFALAQTRYGGETDRPKPKVVVESGTKRRYLGLEQPVDLNTCIEDRRRCICPPGALKLLGYSSGGVSSPNSKVATVSATQNTSGRVYVCIESCGPGKSTGLKMNASGQWKRECGQ